MIVGEALVEPVVAAMEAQGALDDQTRGQFCVSPVPRAFTYVAKRRK